MAKLIKKFYIYSLFGEIVISEIVPKLNLFSNAHLIRCLTLCDCSENGSANCSSQGELRSMSNSM